MRILVSNDDGYQSQGLHILVEKLKQFAEVAVVAPDQNRSAASHSLTVTRPLRMRKVGADVYAVDGTPTDCVHLAITNIFQKHLPDIVISGVNHGENLGDDVLYSGTVAAAIEGRFLGLPALAVSAVSPTRQCFETAAQVTQQIVQNLAQASMGQAVSKDVVLNINVPGCTVAEIVGIQGTRLGNRHLSEPAIKAKDPRGGTIYWVGSQGKEQDAGEGTDFFAVANKYVSVTPLHIDLTKHQDLERLRQWATGFRLQQ